MYIGSNFAPTPKLPDLSRFNEDIQNFVSRLRRSYTLRKFQNQQERRQVNEKIQQLERTVIKQKVKSYSKPTDNAALELFIKKVSETLLVEKPKRKINNPPNMDKATGKAIQDMSTWKDRIIRPFDKGSGLFVLDREDYIKRTITHLEDESTFEKITNKQEMTDNAIDAITQWAERYKKEKGMTDRIKKWVIPTGENKPGNNYSNPKAHKPEKDYPSRLRSTGCNSHVRNLSELTAIQLKEVPLEYKVNDTDHFLQKIHDLNESGKLEDKTIYHVTFDITSMFPSIPKSLGLQECKKRLDKRVNPLFSTECILEAIEITLDHNLTEFNEAMNKQKKGTAMGPHNACAYADTALNALDEKLNEDNQHLQYKPLLWAPFRDDIYIPWVEDLEKLNAFHDWLNEFHPDIKFEMSEPSLNGVEFLDTFVYTHKGKLHTRPYSKPSDNHLYLVPSSCHPNHILENNPYSIALRIFKITSEESEYLKAKEESIMHFTRRGYNKQMVANSFEKVEQKNRLDLIYNRKERDKKICHPMVCDYNPALPNTNKVIGKFKYLLDLDAELCKIVPKESVFVSYRAAPTLKDMLIHSKLPSLNPPLRNQENNAGCHPCKDKCHLCKYYLVPRETVSSYHNSRVFNIKQYIDCTTPDVIYLVNDDICKQSYVGCTTGGMNPRWSNHKCHIKKGIHTCEFVSHLLNNPEKHILDKTSTKNYDISLSTGLSIYLLEHVKVELDDNVITRLEKCEKREDWWQKQMCTMAINGGLNKRDGQRKLTYASK